MKILSIFFSLSLCSILSAQDITNTLGAGGNFVVRDAVNTHFVLQQSTGYLGIGSNVTIPRSQLEIGGLDGLLVTGTFGSGTALDLGAGTRLHWYPRKGAFRTGSTDGNYWNDASIGNYSIAMGYQPRAAGAGSVAIGTLNYATGNYSLALGSYTQATGIHSIAIGFDSWATGPYSVAIGQGCSTNGYDGAMVIGDNTPFARAYANAENSLTMRFAGGFRFWTSYSDSMFGVYMRPGTSGWSNYSSRDAKKNFRELDGEEVLQKIHDIPVTEWCYKGVDSVKYIGPVAQDFYAAFHLGGTDSLGINTISIDGVNMAGVRALEKRTREMRSEIAIVKEENERLRTELSYLRSIVEDLGKTRNSTQDER